MEKRKEKSFTYAADAMIVAPDSKESLIYTPLNINYKYHIQFDFEIGAWTITETRREK